MARQRWDSGIDRNGGPVCRRRRVTDAVRHQPRPVPHRVRQNLWQRPPPQRIRNIGKHEFSLSC